MADALDRLAERFVSAYSWGVPDLEGNVMDVGVFSPGLRGVMRPVPWDVFASATVPGLRGDHVHFAVARSGSVISQEHVSAKALEPLVKALLGEIDAPFVAIAVRDEGDAWAEGANRAQVVDLPVKGDEIAVTRLGDQMTTTVDGDDSDVSFPELEKLISGDGTVMAHRFVGSAWVAEVFPL
jgi:hypothetical protein